MAVIDSYSETNQDSSGSFASAITQVGQSVTGDGTKINSAKFYLKKSGAPSYNLNASIFAHTGTFGTSSAPTGTALATSDSVSTTSLTTSFSLYTFTFTGANQITLTNGTKYVLVLNGTPTGFTDFVTFGYDISSPTHSGNFWDDSGGPLSTADLVFYLESATGLTITTNATSSVTARTAIGNGNITDVTSGNADERGIVYSTSTQAAPGNVAPASSGYSGLANETGSFSTGAFTESLTGLSPLTRYYARAYAHNTTDGYIYGSEVNFITGLEVAWFRA